MTEKNEHKGHEFRYILLSDFEQLAEVTEEGDLKIIRDLGMREVYDAKLYCQTCLEYIVGGEAGLSEFYEVV